jgi:hypothetical protein
MSIQEIRQKINILLDFRQLFWLATIFGLTLLAIGLFFSFFNTKHAQGVEITTFDGPAFTETSIESSSINDTKETVYASKNGKKFYYSDCSGLKRIKQENRLSFINAALAEQAGYTKAANCH